MKKYIQYIFLALIIGLISVSCIQELELETPVAENEVMTLVPRVQSFANKYVTKAEYDGDEIKISSLTLLVFNSEGEFAYKKNLPAGATSFTLNKSMISKGDMSSSTVVMLANITLGELKTADEVITEENIVNLTVSALEASTYTPSSISSVIKSGDLSSINGLPMIGGQKGVNLSSSKDQQSAIEIPLKMLYAKVNFQIAVAADGSENQYLHDGVKFNMTGCTINNTTHTTTLAIPDNKGQAKVDFLGYPVKNDNGAEITAEANGATPSSDYYNDSAATPIHSGSSISKGNQLDLTFYILESRFNHGLTIEEIAAIYPWGTSDGYEKYQQMYKPELAKSTKGEPAIDRATFVNVAGTYTDYRGTNWNVDYTVYLGKDNAQNFQVDRNSEYTNVITIKGIRNNSDYGDGDVWIDHRVNVELGQGQGLDDCITITRETLIDSHFEVRPLRINLTGKNYKGACVFLPRYNGKQITEKKGDGVNQNWIAIENNNGTRYQDITQYCANGKRKYFTTDLIEDLHLNNPDIQENSSELVIPLENNDCIWIYIDEYTTSGATSVREAQIELRFYKSTTSYDSEIYTIRQKPLHPVGNYYIESYEEYLHSYDSEDNYNLGTSTKDYPQPGIVWGLAGEALSNDVLVSVTPLIGIGWIDIRNSIDQRYDYLPSSDESRYRYVKNGNSWSSVNSENPEGGLEFTGRASARTNMTIIDMGNPPSSAYQYCLSKNKFKKGADGSHSMDIHWYLPDVYELQLILAAGQSSADMVDNAYYWSSQPAFDIKGLDELPLISELVDKYPSLLEELGVDPDALGVFDEDITYARAVAGKAGVSNEKRTETHRVRCLYSETGIPNVNMANRAPDGIGPKVIHMRARRLDTGGAGYFAQYVPSSPTKVDPKTTKEFEGDDDDYVYPTVGTLADRSFESDPMQNWVKTIKVEGNNLYPDENQFTLGRYPGLSAKVIGNRKISQDGLFTYYHTIDETSEWKSDTEIVESVTKKEVNYSNLGDNELTLNKLDGTNGIFSIAFSIGNNTKNYPKYYYYEETGKVTETWTRHWMVPEYLSSKDQYDQTLPGENFTASGIVGRAGLYYDDLFNKWRVATTNAFTTRYNNQDNAKAAALNDAIKNAKADIDSQVETIRSENQYDSNPSIDYHESDARQNAPTPKVETSGRYYGVTYTITMDATVIFTKTGTRTVWKYSANTGRWYNEEDEEWPSMESDDNTWPNFYKKDEAPNPKVTNDELTFYSGNSFTISVDQGYVIGGVKVHFSGSNSISRTDTYLRFVPEGYNSSTGHPERMSFVDGDSGYAEWGTQEGCSQVTLQLSEATLTEPSWIQQIFGQKATINYKTNNLSYTSESVIIEKIEITYMSDSN